MIGSEEIVNDLAAAQRLGRERREEMIQPQPEAKRRLVSAGRDPWDDGVEVAHGGLRGSEPCIQIATDDQRTAAVR